MSTISTTRHAKTIVSPAVYTALIFICLVVFEIFSYGSSYEALMTMFGIHEWAALLAFCFSAVDFAGLAKLYSPDLRNLRDPQALLFAAWLLSAFADTGLTYVVVSNQLLSNTTNIMVTSGTVPIAVWAKWIPALFSVLVWLIQVLLVARLSVSSNEHK